MNPPSILPTMMYFPKKYHFFCGILVMGFVLSVCLYLQVDGKYKQSGFGHNANRTENYYKQRGMGCKMPDLNPFAEEMMKLIEKRSKITCNEVDWVTCEKSKCFVIEEILDTMKDIVCTYTDILFVDDMSYGMGESVRRIGREKYTLSKSDHVKVSCIGIRKNGFAFFPSRWFGHKSGFRDLPVAASSQQGSTNVLILSFDSVSRNAFIRLMPQSYKVLTEELNAVVLKSYNIIGSRTVGAMFPILTGKKVEEIVEYERAPGKTRLLDDLPFIFYALKANGYRTAYAEDSPWIGTFQLYYNGFQHQPVDDYLRTFFLKQSDDIVHFWGRKNAFCVGAVPQYAFMLHVTDQFLQLDGKRFGFTFIADITHDDLNMLPQADEDVAAFLKKFNSDGRTEDTMLIVMGDHGARYGGNRFTYQGALEERMPLMAFVLPEQLKRSRPRAEGNLRANANVLTTPLDLHATLVDVTGVGKAEDYYNNKNGSLPRAMHLLEPIPANRSCFDAEIDPFWCACTDWYTIAMEDDMFLKVADALANAINSLTMEVRHLCLIRRIRSIEGVWCSGFSRRYNNIDSWKGTKDNYRVKLIMSPGRAVFEGLVKYHHDEERFDISSKEISRISVYGNESLCVKTSHPLLLQYCYCKDYKEIIEENAKSNVFNI